VDRLDEMLSWAQGALSAVREAIKTEAEGLKEKLESAQGVVQAQVSSLAATVQQAQGSTEAALAEAASGLLPEFATRLESMAEGFKGDLQAAVSDLTQEWKKRLEEELKGRVETGVESVRGLLAALAQEARESAQNWSSAREAAEPGFVEVEKNLDALDKGVVCVKEAASRVGLNW
jgi:hypothetical protein